MGRARNFDLQRFEDALRQAGPGRRSDLLCRLLSDWIGRSFDPHRVERTRALVPHFREMRERSARRCRRTVLLHHFHTLKGLSRTALLGHDVDRLRLSAITDPLTGPYNRRFLRESPLPSFVPSDPAILFRCDADRELQIDNDRFGHTNGDAPDIHGQNHQ
jgi:hypothetical protein